MLPTETPQKQWETPEVKLLDEAKSAKAGGGGPLDGGANCS